MEGTNGITGMIPLNNYPSHDFGVIDFMDKANFNQFIDLIRGENEIEYSVANLIGNHQLNGGSFHDPDGSFLLQDSFANSQFFSPAPAMDLFDFDVTTNIDQFAQVSECAMPSEELFLKDQVEERAEEEMMDEEGSSGTMTTSTKSKKGKKADRSRTLVSERKRRGRMKEKLYALRSLVPNITKVCSYVIDFLFVVKQISNIGLVQLQYLYV